jgi:excisionase family DNA binding protein
MSSFEDMSEYTLSVREVAALLNVQPMTIRRWIADGRLPARRLPGTKPYKLRKADVDALIEGSDVASSQNELTSESAGMAGIDSAAMLLDSTKTSSR